MGNLTFKSDDHILLINGKRIQHFIRGRLQPDTGSRITPIEVADGVIGRSVGPAGISRPGSGSFALSILSPQLAELAETSANGDEVTVTFAVKPDRQAKYSYTAIHLTAGTLGPVPIGPDSTAPEVEVSVSGTGYKIDPK